MDAAISLVDVANILTFVAPGYFALQVYNRIFAKQPKEFPKLLVESVIFSLPIVAVTQFIWQEVLQQGDVATINAGYAALVLTVAVASGIVAAILRTRRPIRTMAARFGFGAPDEDFIRAQFARLRQRDDAVTIALKSGEVFSGTPKRGSVYSLGGPRQYYFDNIAQYNPSTNRWQGQDGGLIIDMSEVEYIATPPLKED